MNSTISIILPAYRAQVFLPSILDDICAQTYTDWELICVSNGQGNEEQCSILEKWKAKDERIHVINTTLGGGKLGQEYWD